MLDIAATAALVFGGSLAARGSLEPWVAHLLEGMVAVGVVGAALAVLALRRPLARWPRRLRRPVGRTLVALRYLARNRRAALTAITISLLMQAGFVLVNVGIGRAVGISVPVAVWFVAWPLAKIVGLVPISLGGLAVRDAALAGLLVPAGVPAALGVAAGLVWQSVMLGGGLLGALVWWLHSLHSTDGFSLSLRGARTETASRGATP